MNNQESNYHPTEMENCKLEPQDPIFGTTKTSLFLKSTPSRFATDIPDSFIGRSDLMVSIYLFSPKSNIGCKVEVPWAQKALQGYETKRGPAVRRGIEYPDEGSLICVEDKSIFYPFCFPRVGLLATSLIWSTNIATCGYPYLFETKTKRSCRVLLLKFFGTLFSQNSAYKECKKMAGLRRHQENTYVLE